jgi:hypothetical protein
MRRSHKPLAAVVGLAGSGAAVLLLLPSSGEAFGQSQADALCQGAIPAAQRISTVPVAVQASYASTGAGVSKWDESMQTHPEASTPASQYRRLPPTENVAACIYTGNFEEPAPPGHTFGTLVMVVEPNGNSSVESAGPANSTYSAPPSS